MQLVQITPSGNALARGSQTGLNETLFFEGENDTRFKLLI